MSRVYEVMFIVRPDVVEEEVDKLIAGFSTNVTNGGGVIKNVDKMGRRKLAYMVRKFNDGNYVLMTIEANGAVVLELERRLRVTEPIIKFITVRIDEEEKRLAKVKALRGVRRKATPEPQPRTHRRRLRLSCGACLRRPLKVFNRLSFPAPDCGFAGYDPNTAFLCSLWDQEAKRVKRKQHV